MQVYIIPSWYPFKRNPVSGVFIKEQVKALGTLYPEDRFFVGLWGQKAFNLQLRKPVFGLMQLSDYLASKSHENQISPNIKEMFTPCLSWYVKFYQGNIRRIIQICLKQLQSLQAAEGFIDLIHAHASFPAGVVARELSQKTGIPYVLTEHMSPFAFSHFMQKDKLVPMTLHVIEDAKKRIVVSPVLAEFLRNQGIQDVEVIPNFVDEDFFKPAPGKSIAAPFRFFAMGRMTPNKGIDDLLLATKLLLQKQKNIQLHIAGEGDRWQYYQSLAKRLRLENHVKWLGTLSRPDVLRAYQNCDCFILPSHSETFGVVFVEAIACGKPVIATRCGGPEMIVNNKNGMLVQPKDIQDIANAMERMIETYKNYEPKIIREDFLKRFSKNAVIPNIMDIYLNMIKDKTIE